jgi:hypothetical protein
MGAKRPSLTKQSSQEQVAIETRTLWVWNERDQTRRLRPEA